jgi:hypothetical protein
MFTLVVLAVELRASFDANKLLVGNGRTRTGRVGLMVLFNV